VNSCGVYPLTGSACYPRRTFYPLSDAPSFSDRAAGHLCSARARPRFGAIRASPRKTSTSRLMHFAAVPPQRMMGDPNNAGSDMKKDPEVEKVTGPTKGAFIAPPVLPDSDEQADALREFVENNAGTFTYGEIAEQFDGGSFTAKQIQGKILSLELTGSVKPTPKAENVKTYSDDEEARVVAAIQAGKFVEEIAADLGRTVPSIRGKALSLLRAGTIAAMPSQRDVKGAAPDAFEALGDVSGLTVTEVAAKLEKTERGVKTMLTRRGVSVKDYDGAAKREKAQASA